MGQSIDLTQIHPDSIKIESMPKSIDLTQIHPDNIKVEESGVEELMRHAGIMPEQPGLAEKAVGAVGKGIGWLDEKNDQYLASPMRAGLNKVTGGESNYSYGDIAPPTSQILEKNLGVDNTTRKSVPTYYTPNMLTKTRRDELDKQGVFDKTRGEYRVEGQSLTPAEAIGGAMDLTVLDPTNALALGAGAIAKWTGKALKGVNEGLFGIKMAKNAPEIEAATKAIGGSATPGQLLDSSFVKKQENLMAQSEGYLGGYKLRDQIQKNHEAATNAADEILSLRAAKQPDEVGLSFETKFKDELSKKLEPAEQIYGAWEDALRQTGLPVSKKYMSKITSTLANEVKFSSEGRAALSEASQNISNLKSIDDLKQYRTTVGRKLKAANLDNNERYVLSNVYHGLSAARSESLETLARLPQYKEFGDEAVKQLKAADQMYAEASDSVENALLKKGKRGNGPKATTDRFFNETTEISRLNKVLQTADPAKITKLAADYPEAFDVLRRGKIQEIFKDAEANNKVNYAKMLKSVDDWPDKSKALVFGEDSSKKIKALKQFFESKPPQINPSQTAITELFKKWSNIPAQASSVLRSTIFDILTKPTLGTDPFTKLGNSEMLAPMLSFGTIAPKTVQNRNRGLSIPGKNPGLALPVGE